METNTKNDMDKGFIFICILSLLIVVIGSASMLKKSETYDETFYVGVGYYLVKTNNFAIDAIWSHTPLSFHINSIPFYILDLTGQMPKKDEIFLFNESTKEVMTIFELPDCFRCWDKKYYDTFIYGDEYRSLNLLFLSRCSMLLTLILLCIYFFKLSRELFGLKTACILTTLLAFNPNILAHSSLATTDMTPTCFNFISFYYLLKFRKEDDIKTSLKFGIAIGLTLLSKVSGLYTVFIYAIIILSEDFIRTIKFHRQGGLKQSNAPKWGSYAIVLVSALLVLNAGYFFNDTPTDYLSKPYNTLTKPHNITLPVPEKYLWSLATAVKHLQMGHDSYYLGREKMRQVVIDASNNSEPEVKITRGGFGGEYWFTTFLIKTPEGILLLIGIAAVYHLHKYLLKKDFSDRNTGRAYAYAIAYLFLNTIALITSGMTIGIRFMLILFPMMYLMLGEPLKYLLQDSRLKALGWLIILISLAPAAYYFPHYLAYFNQLTGGPENGYKYLSDSNIDWGQDLPGLKQWMDEHNASKIKLAYFGRGRIEKYGIDYTSLPNNMIQIDDLQKPPETTCDPQEGLMAISVTSLTGQYTNPHCYDWLKNVKPTDNIGYSILIYNITKVDDLKAA